MKPFFLTALGLSAVFFTNLSAEETDLQPILAVPAAKVYESDLSRPAPLNKEEWTPRQATRWTIEEGVLRGRESTAENQASKSNHRGLEPRLSAPMTPKEFVMHFSVRFIGGEETAIVPFIEFGHHIVRVRSSSPSGLSLLVDHESTMAGEAKEFHFVPGEWTEALAELKGNEFVIQFRNGPVLYVRHPILKESVSAGGSGFGLAGPKGGTAEIDNVTIWEVEESPQAGWEERRTSFPKFDPILLKEKPKP